MDIEQMLAQAEALISQNQDTLARLVLVDVIRQSPENETAWVLSARVSEKPEQVLYCLRRALKINPNNARANAMLAVLQPPPQPPAFPQPPQSPAPTISPAVPAPALELEPITEPHLSLPPAASTPPPQASAQPAPLPALSNATEPVHEKVYFQDGQVYISSARLVFGQTTLLIPDLISVVSSRSKSTSKIVPGLLLILVALASCGFGAFTLYGFLVAHVPLAIDDVGIHASQLILALVLAFVGIVFFVLGLWLVLSKPKYLARVTTAAGVFDVAASRDPARINKIVQRIQQAVTAGAVPPPLP